MIPTTIERAIKVLAKLLSYEASRHAKQASHNYQKGGHHLRREQDAIDNMVKAGKQYRASLYAKADVHERHADKANALASKLGGLL